MTGPTAARFRALFDPRAVLVAGASTHPGKFGFVALHNIISCGYQGAVHATNRDGAEVLGIRTVRDVAELPDGEIDLVFVCTPAGANVDLLRSCAKKGITAAFIASAGYGEAGDDGRRAQDELVAVAEEVGILLAGPNGQGVVSTPAQLCAQIVGPYPPAGRIGVASQSGNLVSAFQNYAGQTGVGISRAVSAGNAAAVTVPDYLEFFADDPETAVALAYVEGVGVGEGRAVYERLRQVAERMPIVLVKGGRSADGQRAAASHTGSLASDDRVFDGMCRQAGVQRAASVEQAFDVAATFATQPLPRGNRVAVVTTAGGWGVATADALSQTSLQLAPLPDDLRAAIDEHLPPRWSRNNPIDMAGGETRDTVPAVLDLAAGHPDIDAVIVLGIGIQSNQAKLMRRGPFFPDHGPEADPSGRPRPERPWERGDASKPERPGAEGAKSGQHSTVSTDDVPNEPTPIERIVAYHERQDARFAQAAIDASERTGKPVLVATELAVTVPDNPGVATLRDAGRLCHASAHRAVAALDHLWQRARWLQRRGLQHS